MYHFYKDVRNSKRRFLRTLFSWSMFLLLAGSFLLFPPANCQGEEITDYPAAQTMEENPEPMAANLSLRNMDFAGIAPMSWVNTYVEQLRQDIAYNQKNIPSPDQTVIPDKRNTGIQENVQLKPFTESGYIGMIAEEEGATGRRPLYLTVKDNEFYNINGYSNTKCASRVLIENYNFEDAKLYITNDQKLPGEVILIFRNCKFRNIRSIPGPNLWIILDHCQTDGNIYASNIIIRNSYLHSRNCDAINPISNVVVKDSYVADLLQGPSDKGVHIDGVQIFGNQYGGISENIIFDNVRFSIPQLSYEGSGDYVNAAISTGLEFSEGQNFLFQNIIIDSGGRWFPIYNTGGDAVLFKNIQVGGGHTSIFYNRYVNPKAVVEDTRLSTGLYVSSVWKDAENRTHFLCSNNTGTAKTLTVVTDQQNYTFSIERHPTAAELSENPQYREYRFQDLPYDIEFIIEEDITQAVFYDGNRQIRSVKF